QMRDIEFVADELGDWAIHCHKSHHTMNAMGHTVKTYIGADLRKMQKQIRKFEPGYMAMGSSGMADMAAMEMPLPDNTLPMMTGYAQFGPVEMGGMFSVLKVREGLAAGDYKDPGWYGHPEGEVARLVSESDAAPAAAPRAKGARDPRDVKVDVRAVKPAHRHKGHE
ncbi:MAG: multicopper oxidase domain-containing protein, partial [Rhodoblastus sp.]